MTAFVDGYQPSITYPLWFFDVYIQIQIQIQKSKDAGLSWSEERETERTTWRVSRDVRFVSKAEFCRLQ